MNMPMIVCVKITLPKPANESSKPVELPKPPRPYVRDCTCFISAPCGRCLDACPECCEPFGDGDRCQYCDLDPYETGETSHA